MPNEKSELSTNQNMAPTTAEAQELPTLPTTPPQQMGEIPVAQDTVPSEEKKEIKETSPPIVEKSPEIPLILEQDVIDAGTAIKATGEKTVSKISAQLEQLGNLP